MKREWAQVVPAARGKTILTQRHHPSGKRGTSAIVVEFRGSVDYIHRRLLRAPVAIHHSFSCSPPPGYGFTWKPRMALTQDTLGAPEISLDSPITVERTENVQYMARISSETGAFGMAGRASRSWQIQKPVEGVLLDRSYAPKDIWVREGRIPEHGILSYGRGELSTYPVCFLTPLDCGFVSLDPDEPQPASNTHETLGHRKGLKLTGETSCRRFGEPSQRSLDDKGCSSTSNESVGHSDGRRVYILGRHARRHHRILLEEIGKPVHDLRNFTDVFTAIRGGTPCDDLSGYVHRDVSSGNILLVDPHGNKRGVIMDLEYAKKIGDMNELHDVKTGTAEFMATEVAFTRHHRLRSLQLECQINLSIEALKSWGKSDRDDLPLPSIPEPPPLPPFRYNPLHDMESVWWLCVWIMFYLSCSKKKRLEQYENFRQVFGSQYTKERFSKLDEFGLLTSHLSETPEMASDIKSWLLMLNYHYTDCYKDQDSWTDPPTILQIDNDTIEESYTFGRKILMILGEASESLPKCMTLSERLERKNSTIGKSPRRILNCVLLPPPKKRRARQILRETLESWGKSNWNVHAPSSSELPPLPLFRHNPLHDMEPVWWLCLWMMFDLSLSEEKRGEQFQNYHWIFDSQRSKQRFSKLRDFSKFTSHLSEIPGFASIQDSLMIPPTILRVDDHMIELSYNYGRKTLMMLKEVSKPLPTCATLSKHFQVETPMTTAQESSRRILENALLPPPKKYRIEK
ncbi:hypothetical protein FRC11_004290 [Ceratobasidium sp. 423]|nr:hypothetical protein FRC11_004290 [Ceratobasidium sp. 423]